MDDVTWTEVPLVGLAPVGLSMVASWCWESGWRVRLSAKLSGDGSPWTTDLYEGMATDEIAQLLSDWLDEL